MLKNKKNLTVPKSHTMSASALRVLSAILLTVPLLTDSVVYGASNVTISVNCGVSQGNLFRAEDYFNLSSMQAPSALNRAARPGDIQFFNEQGLHTKIQRAWLKEQDIYDPSTGLFNNYQKIDEYLAQVSNMGDEILLNISATKVIKELQYTPAQFKPIVRQYIKHVIQKFPKVKYIEVMNEPDGPNNAETNYYPVIGTDSNGKPVYGSDVLNPGNIYSYYKVFYEAVNEINAEVKPRVPLRVGGPALYYFNLDWLKGFLDGYKNDPSPNKKLDFVSYHAYLKPNPGTGANLFYKDNIKIAEGERSALEAEFRSRGLSTNIPSFITESGMYPGPMGDDLDVVAVAKGKKPTYDYIDKDQVRQAAGMASLAYTYRNTSDKVYPFGWDLRHSSNGRKDALVCKDKNDIPLSQVYSNKFTPYGNLLEMQSKMKLTRVADNSSSVDNNGKGVYSLAAKDNSGVSMMVWNYQGTGTMDYNATVNVANLPYIFNGKNIRAKTYKINNTTSNYYVNPDNGNLQMVNDQILTNTGSYNTTLALDPNCIELLVLEPVSNDVLLTDNFDDQVTGAATSWAVNNSLNTTASIANKPSVSNRSVCLGDNSMTDTAAISKTFASQTGSIVAQWRFMGDSKLTSGNFQLRSGTTVAADLSINANGALVANGKVLQSITPGQWYSIKVSVDIKKGLYNVFINGTLKQIKIPLSTTVTTLDNISFQTGKSDKNLLYVDEVLVTTAR